MPKGPSTKVRIEECAITLFSKNGYAATAMREIAEAAKVTKPVVYYYFGSKENLCQHIISSELSRFKTLIGEVCKNKESNIFKGLISLVQVYLDFCDANVDFVRFLYAISFGPDRKKINYDFYAYDEELFRLRMKLLRRAAESRLIRKGKEEAAIIYLEGIINAYVMQRIDEDREFPEGLARTIVTDMIEGLQA